MRKPLLAPLVLLLLPAGMAAQEMQHPAHHRAVQSVRPLYERIRELYIRAAEAMPAEHYGYRPTPAVRTFGEILGHVANETFLFCAYARGEPDPNQVDYEKAAKPELVKGLRDSFAYCDPAYQMDEMKAMEEMTAFGRTGTRLWVLIYNVTHDSEHWGNIVTYMREKGLVPPSSAGGP